MATTPKYIQRMKHPIARNFWAEYAAASPSLPWTQFVDFFTMEFMDEQPDLTAAQQQALKEAIDGDDGDGAITTREFDRWAVANTLGESWFPGVPPQGSAGAGHAKSFPTPPSAPAPSFPGGAAAEPCDDSDEDDRSFSDSVKWLVLGEGGHLEVDERGTKLLRSERGAVNTVMIFGDVGTGKSFLLNSLDPTANFEVSNREDSCTQGVDLAGAPKARPGLPAVTYVDVEGQGDKSLSYELKLAVPLLLCSKVCIMNLMCGSSRAPRNSILQKLELMMEAAAKIGEKRERKGAFPHLHIVCRDMDQDASKLQRTILDDEDHEDCDDDEGEQEAKRRNGLRSKLRVAFSSIGIWSLPHPLPGGKPSTLEEANCDFQAKVAQLRDVVNAQMKVPKTVDGKLLTGPMMAELVKQISTTMMDDHTVLSPKTMMEAVYEDLVRASVKTAIDTANRAIEEMELPDEEFDTTFSDSVQEEAMRVYDEDVMPHGAPDDAVTKGRSDLEEQLKLREDKLRARNDALLGTEDVQATQPASPQLWAGMAGMGLTCSDYGDGDDDSGGMQAGEDEQAYFGACAPSACGPLTSGSDSESEKVSGGGAGGIHLKKDGTPDMRYKENRVSGGSTTKKTYSYADSDSEESDFDDDDEEDGSPIHLKKDGTPDRRYTENR